MSSDIGHFMLTRCECENELSGSGGEWVQFSTPTPTGNLVADKNSKEWIWTDSTKFALYHTRYSAENHIGFVQDGIIYLYRILK